MTPVEIARLQQEITAAADPAALRAADWHAVDCYRRQLIDAAALDGLHQQAEAHLAEIAGGGR